MKTTHPATNPVASLSRTDKIVLTLAASALLVIMYNLPMWICSALIALGDFSAAAMKGGTL